LVRDVLKQAVDGFGVGGVDTEEEEAVLVDVELLLEATRFVREEIGDHESIVLEHEATDEGAAKSSRAARDYNCLLHVSWCFLELPVR
jgi:hypothetical protein